MKSTPETILEAQRALARYMESERLRQQGELRAQQVMLGAGASFNVEDGAQHVPESPRQRATDYAKARNQNLRPMRQMDETDENARAGRDSALAYLERRRRSAVRK
jgi:hypothetical protein